MTRDLDMRPVTMPRLSSPGPPPGEKGPRKGLGEPLELEEDEGGREARRREPRPGGEGVGGDRLGGVEGEEDPRRVGVVRGSGHARGGRETAGAKPAEVLVGQLPEDVGRVADEDRAVLEEGVRARGVVSE